MLHWASTHMHDPLEMLVNKIPLATLLLIARQEQYAMDDRIMTLGDKELIDTMNQNKEGTGRNG